MSTPSENMRRHLADQKAEPERELTPAERTEELEKRQMAKRKAQPFGNAQRSRKRKYRS